MGPHEDTFFFSKCEIIYFILFIYFSQFTIDGWPSNKHQCWVGVVFFQHKQTTWVFLSWIRALSQELRRGRGRERNQRKKAGKRRVKGRKGNQCRSHLSGYEFTTVGNQNLFVISCPFGGFRGEILFFFDCVNFCWTKEVSLLSEFCENHRNEEIVEIICGIKHHFWFVKTEAWDILTSNSSFFGIRRI